MTDKLIIGFIGLGVMGEPMCRNLARKSGAKVIAFDLRPEPLQRLKPEGVGVAASARELMEEAAAVMLSLPSGSEVAAICAGNGCNFTVVGTSAPMETSWFDGAG